jgi:hypothetical protein
MHSWGQRMGQPLVHACYQDAETADWMIVECTHYLHYQFYHTKMHDMNELVCAIDSPHGAFQHGGKVRELIATAIEFRKVWAKSAHEQFDLVFECL